MRKRVVFVGILAALAFSLGGCLMGPTPSSPQLVVSFGIPRNVVICEVVGISAMKYVWDFGDGTTAETTIPKVMHRYEIPGTYVVVVKGYGTKRAGDGAPGPGVGNVDALVFQLEAIVDTRPALEIIGIKVEPVNPPYWYGPGTPAWPDWHFPANTHLRFSLLYKVHRPGELEILRVHWIVLNQYGNLVASQSAREWIWYEAATDFRVYGCPGAPTEYRVYVAIQLTDGSVEEIRQSIWACPPGGCR